MAAPGSNVVELLHPGSFVRLRDHPEDLPPFQLIQRRGNRCWVRQQAWGPRFSSSSPTAASPPRPEPRLGVGR